jgi:hypothetical protein
MQVVEGLPCTMCLIVCIYFACMLSSNLRMCSHSLGMVVLSPLDAHVHELASTSKTGPTFANFENTCAHDDRLRCGSAVAR